MPLSLNEIKSRALAFSNEWAGETNEDAEAKSFWDGFFHIFGISRRRMATFEQAVAREGRGKGFIDLLWKGTLLVEHKSAGKNLERAYAQAKDYFPGLKDHELPRYIIVCDFENFRLYDLDEGWDKSFTLGKLVDNLHLFDFLSGYKRHVFEDQAPINIKAAEMMAMLHDELKAYGYEGHRLELYLVRLLFCLFADDTNIFEKGIFYDLLENRTHEDGSDLAGWLAQLFDVLDCPADKRMRNLDEMLAAFPYVNGRLFEERLPMAAFDAKMRKLLLDCCALDWSAISPAIFGSLFQGVMDEKARRNLGAHYTSEKNIMKLIKPLFFDELWAEFEKVKGNQRQLEAFHGRIAGLRFLDPACGCGNFLIIAYRELRMLEIEVLRARFKNQIATHIDLYVSVNVDQFYGIEYEEFPAQIAQVAMWLMDHQMNIRVSEAFGEYYARLPLKKSATIVHGNALRTDWQGLIQEKGVHYDYILGNPPFIGHHLQTETQKEDLHFILHDIKAAGVMDYVSAWFYKSAEYLATQSLDNKTKVAFVSTNSIAQGEQVGILWSELMTKYHLKIHFAHRTFKWTNEAKGNAAVYCVIIGFSNFDVSEKRLFVYEDIKGEPHEIKAKNINPYLVDAIDVFVSNRNKPICNVPDMMYGSKPTDGGYFLFTDDEKRDFLKTEPNAKKFVKPFISAREFINGEKRWCLWLVDADPSEIKQLPEVIKRVNAVKKFRSESVAASTRNYAYHTLFRQVTQPNSDYLLVPRTTSENRKYIPIGFFNKNNIVSDTCQSIPNASLLHFGVISSEMHMVWVNYTCGRLKSDYRYSKDIVYNNYPWPEHPTGKQTAAVEKAAQAVLDARAQYPDASLADLYGPNTMPPALVKAHQALDKAVDLCYRPQPFATETKRIEYLFELYDKYTAGMFAESKNVKSKRKK